MTQAVVVKRDGDAFQARYFWSKAARLLDPGSHIVRVGFETGPKGFDDIFIEYAPPGLKDQKGNSLVREHIQCKWHVAPGSYGHADLVDPEFINANAHSLLQRALSAQQKITPKDGGVRFRLMTNWRVDLNDPLRELINNRSHTLRLDKLYAASTDNSIMGKVRKLWREHLAIDEDALRTLVLSLAFSETADSLDIMRENLDPLLQVCGLKRIPPYESTFVYDDIVFQWLSQGKLEFDRKTFREVCESEGIIVGSTQPGSRIYGVKSFEHATDKLEDRCTEVLDLIPNFIDRQVRSEGDWKSVLYPDLKAFLLKAAKPSESLRLILDAHLSLSFAAGTIIDIKSGRHVELEQRSVGKSIWSPTDKEPDPSWPKLEFQFETLRDDGTDFAVAINITHDTTTAVRTYALQSLPHVRALLIVQPKTGPSARALTCGRHAFDLVEDFVSQIKLTRDKLGGVQRTHLFPACPGGFTFFLGQRHVAMGRLTLYEFDFEGNRSGSYQPSLQLPIQA